MLVSVQHKNDFFTWSLSFYGLVDDEHVDYANRKYIDARDMRNVRTSKDILTLYLFTELDIKDQNCKNAL